MSLGRGRSGRPFDYKIKITKKYKKHFEEIPFYPFGVGRIRWALGCVLWVGEDMVPLDWRIINKNCEEKKLVSFRSGRTKWPLDFHPKEIIKSYNNNNIIMI